MVGLKEDGIPTVIYYPKPLHLQEAVADLGYQYGDLPVSEKMAAEIFSIPMYPYLNENNQDKIVESIKKNA